MNKAKDILFALKVSRCQWNRVGGLCFHKWKFLTPDHRLPPGAYIQDTTAVPLTIPNDSGIEGHVRGDGSNHVQGEAGTRPELVHGYSGYDYKAPGLKELLCESYFPLYKVQVLTKWKAIIDHHVVDYSDRNGCTPDSLYQLMATAKGITTEHQNRIRGTTSWNAFVSLNYKTYQKDRKSSTATNNLDCR